jgi:hypothetical protein
MGDMVKCLRCAVRHPPLVRRAALTALVVGSILTAINQGEALLHGSVNLYKVGLTLLVPYCVTCWGALGNARAGARRR